MRNPACPAGGFGAGRQFNQPGVLSDRSDWENYRMACGLPDAANGHGIRGLQDLVNFTGAGMILGERFHRFPPIAQALVVVKEGRQPFTEMLKSLPADVLRQARVWVSGDDKDKEGA
ncbi:hypothetical protein [Stenotrophomonas sp. MMGLT7]|uniref:hypothetical protein n=1 Tax=Stenotrophomonas sp. MMGLT7 TaxID=2901227 RepID=UPI001E45547E|nr:hypothetical protein [Stenotrophomonas sp. MMGLT7]MCD7099297.1 hypothetical protein [Stenotrophomonas sp. MMGLT7]